MGTGSKSRIAGREKLSKIILHYNVFVLLNLLQIWKVNFPLYKGNLLCFFELFVDCKPKP